MNREEFIKKHIDGKNGLSIFAGAGVSYGSKLPLASTLLDYIISTVMPGEISNNKDFKLSIESLPFEAFIGQMVSYTDNYDIFNIFQGEYEPNENHIFASKMLSCGLLDRVYTVNFDLLYETALKRVSTNVQVLYKDEDFSDENQYCPKRFGKK